jgi:hypothetical protein
MINSWKTYPVCYKLTFLMVNIERVYLVCHMNDKLKDGDN